jgi:hypothetical protein
MNRTSRFVRTPLPFLLTLATLLATAACGSRASSPLSPSAVATATIRGNVETGVTASAGQHSGSSASGIRVSVVGTPLAATTDNSGQFVIDGVPPSGAVALRFEGPGLDARLNLSGLTPGQVLTISVQVAGNHVVLSGSDPSPSSSPSPEPTPSPSPNPGHDHQGEVEFRGTVQSVNAPDLTVDGRLVHTDSATEIKSHGDTIAVGGIVVGSTVEVKGTQMPDGSVLAQRIHVEDGNNDDDGNDDGNENEGNDDDGGGNGGHGGDDGSGHH